MPITLSEFFREAGKKDVADKFKGFDWKTEEDAFMDGYHQHEKGGEFVTYARLRAMGTNGFQEPATGLEPAGAIAAGTSSGGKGEVLQGSASEGPRGKEPVQKDVPTAAGTPPIPAGTERIIGTKRLYADGKFNRPGGKAQFMNAEWRGLQAAGKQAEKDKFAFLINNGRTNHVWQSAYLDVDNELVVDRWPYPFIEMNPQDMVDLGVGEGDLVEVFNDNGSTQAMVYPTQRQNGNKPSCFLVIRWACRGTWCRPA